MLLLLMFSPLTSAVTLTTGEEHYPIATHAEVIRDAEGRITIEALLRGEHQALWRSQPGTTPNYGYDRAAFWFKVRIDSQQSAIEDWILDIDYPLHDYVDVFFVEPDSKIILKSFHTGDKLPHYYRPVFHRNLIFPLSLRYEESLEVYVRLKTDGTVKMPLHLWSARAFTKKDQTYLLTQGIYIGAMVIMFCYNFFLMFVIKEKSFLFYLGYIFFSVTGFCISQGFGFQYLWPTMTAWNQVSIVFTLGAATTFALLFAMNFLRMKQHTPRLYPLMWLAVLTGIFITFGAFVLPYNLMIKWTMYALLVTMLINMVSGVAAMRAKVTSARYFVLAWASVIAGFIMLSLNYVGLVPSSFVVENAAQIGSVMEVVLLSMAYGNWYNEERRAKYAAQAKLLQQQTEMFKAQAQNAAKSEFLAKMSHEIRTPLNGVIGLAELLKDTPLAREQKKFVDTIYNSGQALLRLINDILDLSKIEAQKLVLERTPFNLVQTAEECIALFRSHEMARKLDMRIEVDEDVPASLYGDPTRVRQVILNLLGNAIKFTHAGSVTLKLRLEHLEDSKAQIWVGIQDSGIGIPADKLDTLFKAFSQADASTTRRYGGTGLGLSICRELVLLMGGEIGVDSEEGKGSTFWFRVTLDRAEALPSSSDQSALTPPTQDESLPPLTVLVAEDNKVNQMVVKGMLKKLSVDVIFADDGRQALAIFEQQHDAIDAILMDCEMPEMDGFQATRGIRQFEQAHQLRHHTVVALTAHALGEFRQRCLDAGMDDFLTKPLQGEVLAASLAAIREAKRTA